MLETISIGEVEVDAGEFFKLLNELDGFGLNLTDDDELRERLGLEREDDKEEE